MGINIKPPPPIGELRDFPKRPIATTLQFWRVHHADYLPWWFSDQYRFGLPTPYGTCYLASDPISAILEARFRGTPILAATELSGYKIRPLSLPKEVTTADTTQQLSAGFGITRDFACGNDYSQTQDWAKAFRSAGYGGIWYWPRHNPSPAVGSLALFGTSGTRKSWRRGRAEDVLSDEWIERLRSEAGVRVIHVPSSHGAIEAEDF